MGPCCIVKGRGQVVPSFALVLSNPGAIKLVVPSLAFSPVLSGVQIEQWLQSISFLTLLISLTPCKQQTSTRQRPEHDGIRR